MTRTVAVRVSRGASRPAASSVTPPGATITAGPSGSVELRHLDHQPGSRRDLIPQLESVASNPLAPTIRVGRPSAPPFHARFRLPHDLGMPLGNLPVRG
jgi:hypothetical protein